MGEIKNNLPNGKGIEYYSNGNILYDGDFINGKFKGNGKFIFTPSMKNLVYIEVKRKLLNK